MNKRVLLFIVALVIIVVTILLLKTCNKDVAPTKPLMEVSPTEITMGDAINYNDKTAGATEWEWDFGDDEESTEKNGTHRYTTSGEYYVKLTVNGTISDSMLVKVKDLQIKDTTNNVKIEIDGPIETKVGQKVTFKDNTPKATEWKWKFGETGAIDSKEQTATYTYKNPGKYMVVCTNNSSELQGSKQILVKPDIKPLPAGTTKPKCPTESSIQLYLQRIANGDFDKAYYEMIKKCFCGDETITVNVNGKQNNDLNSYCNGIQIMGNIKILKVGIVCDENTGCVTKLLVSQK